MEKNAKILLIENNAAIRELLVNILRHNGFQCEEEVNSEQALLRMATDEFAVVICGWDNMQVSGASFSDTPHA